MPACLALSVDVISGCVEEGGDNCDGKACGLCNDCQAWWIWSWALVLQPILQVSGQGHPMYSLAAVIEWL